MSDLPLDALMELQRLRGTEVIVYCTNDRSPKNLVAADLAYISRCLTGVSKTIPLDVILHSEGGVVSAARGLALELRAHAARVNILVPYKARSAATLICLAANEIVVGPCAEFSPIDPLIRVDSGAVGKHPNRISSEDIRAYRCMAETWFDLRSEESRLAVFKLLNERFFPTTLASFFRAEQFLRKVAVELLQYQLPQVSVDERLNIVNQLMGGYGGHSDPICRSEILELGLCAKASSPMEAELMASILTGSQLYMNSSGANGQDRDGQKRALFFRKNAGIEFVANRGSGCALAMPRSVDEENDRENDNAAASGWSEIPVMTI